MKIIYTKANSKGEYNDVGMTDRGLTSDYKTTSGFLRYGLPTAMIESDVTLTNLGNLMTVKVNSGNFITLFILNASIIERPILTVKDCSVHQTFDLTHGLKRFG